MASVQAEKLRSKTVLPEQWRSTQQYCRYLYYLGRIRSIQLDYTDARECLQQAVRKVSPLPGPSSTSVDKGNPSVCICLRALSSMQSLARVMSKDMVRHSDIL